MRLLLDTNVISDLRRFDRRNAALFRWRDSVETVPKYLSVISIMEIEFGILRAEERKEKHAPALRMWMDNLILPEFRKAIFGIDTAVALACARLQRIRSVPTSDAAATAVVHGLVVVTRNQRDFEGLGVNVINPWAT